MLRYETNRVFVLVAILSITLWCSIQDVGAPDSTQKASVSGTQKNGKSSDEGEYYNASNALVPTSVASEIEEEPNNEEGLAIVAHRSTETPETGKVGNVNPEFLKNFMKKYKCLPTSKKLKFYGLLKLKVSRERIYEDSKQIISQGEADAWPPKVIQVQFNNESTTDHGGLSREWFYLMSKEIFNPSKGLFEYVNADHNNSYLQINPKSEEKISNHLEHFQFIGKFLGLAISRGRRIRVNLIRSFYTRILNQRISIRDTKAIMTVDSSLQTLVARIRSHPNALKPKLEALEVDHVETITNDDVNEYLRLFTDWKYVAKVENQISAIIRGMEEVIDLNPLRANLNPEELEFLINDKYELDLTEWKEYTYYSRGYKENHPIVTWFWNIIEEYDDSDRRKILQFATGSDALSLKHVFKTMNPPFTISQPKKKTTETIEARINDRKIRIPTHYESEAELRADLDNIIKS